MKASLLLLAVPAALACDQIVQYTQCQTNAGNKIAACSSLAPVTPTLEFYDCLCQEYQASLSCYFICGSDQSIIQQYSIQISRQSAACEGAVNLRKQGFTTGTPLPTSALSTLTVAAPTTTATAGTGGPTGQSGTNNRGYSGSPSQPTFASPKPGTVSPFDNSGVMPVAVGTVTTLAMAALAALWM